MSSIDHSANMWEGGLESFTHLPPAFLLFLQPGSAAQLAQDRALQRRGRLARQAEGRHLERGRQADGAFGIEGGELRAVHRIWRRIERRVQLEKKSGQRQSNIFLTTDTESSLGVTPASEHWGTMGGGLGGGAIVTNASHIFLFSLLFFCPHGSSPSREPALLLSSPRLPAASSNMTKESAKKRGEEEEKKKPC